MHVQVLSHMPFAKIQRKPGDIISESDWMKASDGVRHALVQQGLVRIGGGELQAVESEGETDVILLLQGISAKQDRILGFLEKKAGKKAQKATARKRK